MDKLLHEMMLSTTLKNTHHALQGKHSHEKDISICECTPSSISHLTGYMAAHRQKMI